MWGRDGAATTTTATVGASASASGLLLLLKAASGPLLLLRGEGARGALLVSGMGGLAVGRGGCRSGAVGRRWGAVGGTEGLLLSVHRAWGHLLLLLLAVHGAGLAAKRRGHACCRGVSGRGRRGGRGLDLDGLPDGLGVVPDRLEGEDNEDPAGGPGG